MPLHADNKWCGCVGHGLKGFDDTVAAVCRRSQGRRELIDDLVMP